MKVSRVVLVDREQHTASLLAGELATRGFEHVESVADATQLTESAGRPSPDIVIFNYHADLPESLAACATIRATAPRAAIVALASSGPALKAVRALSEESGAIDVVFEKPLAYERFFPMLERLLSARKSSHELEAKAENLSSLLPEGALSALGGQFDAETELFEAAVLFTDVRDSSRLIGAMPPRDFFRMLNRLLSAHAKVIGRFEGSVVKYTGDGVLAIFRGMGKPYMALRCAVELARDGVNHSLPFGIGVAEGLVLAGFVGDSDQAGHRRQYDVIGATVHLSARLCGLARPGEVITTADLHAVAPLENPLRRSIGKVAIKGFERAIDCVAFGPFTNIAGEPS